MPLAATCGAGKKDIYKAWMTYSASLRATLAFVTNDNLQQWHLFKYNYLGTIVTIAVSRTLSDIDSLYS